MILPYIIEQRINGLIDTIDLIIEGIKTVKADNPLTLNDVEDNTSLCQKHKELNERLEFLEGKRNEYIAHKENIYKPNLN